MYRFKRINNSLYSYRGVDVNIWFDEYNNTSILARATDGEGASVQLYAFGCDFEHIKQKIITRIDEHLQTSSSDPPAPQQ